MEVDMTIPADDSFDGDGPGMAVHLPEPNLDGHQSIENALQHRRSIREYSDDPVTLAEVSQLLWSAQGITDPEGLRAAPSAGALYPLEIYLAAGRVDSLPGGIYRYKPRGHVLVNIAGGDLMNDLSGAALGQDCIRDSAIVIVIAVVYGRTMSKYRERGERYIYMEAGHVGQNISLQAVSLGLGTVMVGAFDDQGVKEVLQLPDKEYPIYLVPVGHER
jgi:SagB-type dehydrogenase family enzyme